MLVVTIGVGLLLGTLKLCAHDIGTIKKKKSKRVREDEEREAESSHMISFSKSL